MKTKNKILYILILACVFLSGCKHTSGTTDDKAEAHVWTCSMDPQVRQDHPGKCPICGMNLIPLKTAEAIDGMIETDAIMLSKEAAALANVQTTIVGVDNTLPIREIRLYGTIQANERLVRSLVSQVSGRIETLRINFAGESIRKGQTVASIYSADLLTAQQELLEALKLQPAQPALLTAAREKLRQWKLTNPQITAIEQSGKVSPIVDIMAETGGIVTAKKVEQGDYVSSGAVLFDLADLSSVWAVFDAYEADLSYLKTGDAVDYTLPALPGKTFSGKIAFIDPALDKATRTAKVRVETANPALQLKPEMYVNAVVKASLKQHSGEIIVPKTAVLWTGKRSIVYVKDTHHDMPVFRLREIELGPSLGDAYVVLSGLNAGETIVTNGAFAIDASAQLEGKRSMMNQEEATHAVLHKVEGACEMCKERIEAAAKSVEGVKEADWNIENKELNIVYDDAKTSLEKISQAIAKAGYDTEKDTADKAAYKALPPCCKYKG